jgi:hypothetical protein
MNQDINDKIEDALIRFEDAGYKYTIQHLFGDGKNNYPSIYDLAKSTDDSKVEVSQVSCISIINDKSGNRFMSWDQYSWFQSELKVAISRMTNNIKSVEILDNNTSVIIALKIRSWTFKNLKKLSEKCRYFNANNGSTNLSVSPVFHPEDGIGIYVREIPLGSKMNRFELLDSSTKKVYKTREEVEYIQGHKITKTYRIESSKVSLEGAFGENCITKYEIGEAEKENPYLKNPDQIVAKIKYDISI